MRERDIERAFVKAVEEAGGAAYKFNSASVNGMPDRLVLFPPGKAAFVEMKAPGGKMRPLQLKRATQLRALGFPVLLVDRLERIEPAISMILDWKPGEAFHGKNERNETNCQKYSI